MEEHFVGKVAQKVILVRSDGKVLITRDSRDGDTWEIPGGRMNVGEQPTEGLRRELKEELGIVVAHCTIFASDTVWHEGETMLLVTYVGLFDGEQLKLNVNPAEVTELAWVNAAELTKYQLFPFLETLLVKYFANQG
jgi:8-oxo-dGTP diphosphatase